MKSKFSELYRKLVRNNINKSIKNTEVPADIENYVSKEKANDLTNKKEIDKRKTSKIDNTDKSEGMASTADSTGANLQSKIKNTNKYFAGIVVATGIGIATGIGTGVASYEARIDPENLDKFDHLLQKDTPITDMIFISAHNAGALSGHGTIPFIANQSMTIKEILDKTPVRSLDIDVYRHNGELIISHTDTLDPTVADSDITKLKDVFTDIHNWQLQHPGEVILLNFEIHDGSIRPDVNTMMDKIFGMQAHYSNLDSFYHNGTAPTIKELYDQGIRILTPHSNYESTGHATLVFNKDDNTGIDNIWEDRSITQYLHGLHPEAAGKINTEDIDRIMDSKKGCVVSLDHITPNDPLFFKPGDRDSLILKSDMETVFNSNVHSDAVNSAMLGIGTAASVGSITLSTVMSVFQGYANEMQIRKQEVIAPKQLAEVEIGSILSARSKKNDNTFVPEILTKPITIEELKETYKKDTIFKIGKTTALPGVVAIVCICASLLSLCLIFPPFMLALGIGATIVGGVGLIATVIATASNIHRLDKSIDRAFQLPQVEVALEKRVALMNQRITNEIADTKLGDASDIKVVFDKILQQSEITDKLMLGLIGTTATSLIARISGFAKYAMPVIGFIAAGVCSVVTIIATTVSAIINFKERRKKLKDISKVVTDKIMPNFAKKSKLKLTIFGKTAIERFIEKDHENLLQALELPKTTSFKHALTNLMLPENSGLLDKYIADFSFQTWNKDLIKVAKTEYPQKDFNEIMQDKQLLNNVFKKYMKNKIAKFASRNTWIAGGLSLLSLIAVSFFCGMFIALPFISIILPLIVLIVGGFITKAAAIRESKLFISRFNNIIDANTNELNSEDLYHRKEIERLLLGWGKLFYKANTDAIDLTEDSTEDDIGVSEC